MCKGYLNENCNSKKGKQSCMGTELHMEAILTKIYENVNFKKWKLIIHDYKNLHGGDLNENENYKKR